MRRSAVLVIAALLSAACSRHAPNLQPALDTIAAGALMNHIRVLSSEEFAGRLPGTPGEEKTVEYISRQFQSYGLKPGNPDGTWVQQVPLVGIDSDTQTTITSGGRKVAVTPHENFTAMSERCVPETKIENSDIVFVGYGVVAPEYGWDDYKGVDVRGKTILMLINDPQVPDPADPAKLDEKMFKGRAMTYYGRWTYKYEIASQKGAAAAIIIHETGPAGYPFPVIGEKREAFTTRRPDRNMGRVPVEGWIAADKAAELLSDAGQSFETLKKQAVRKDFQPLALNAKATFIVRSKLRDLQSRNVIGKLEGNDEYVVYSAHWDHLGRNPDLKGDQVFHGAEDNASGVAGLLELAEAYTKLPEKPKRTILFLATTAEEQGLLGAEYYAENPLYPLKRTLADINLDGLNTWGRTKDITVIGLGNSTLDEVAAEVAREKGRTLTPDPEPEKGYFYRADHFGFAKQGVPAFYTGEGVDYIGKPADFAKRKREEFTANDYHNVTDVIKPDWDLSGAAEDVRLLFEVGYRVAQGGRYPEWKPGTEFKAKRDAMLAGR